MPQVSFASRLPLLLVVIVLGLAGCAPAPSSWVVHERWIDTSPELTIDLEKARDGAGIVDSEEPFLTILASEARPARCSTPGQSWTRTVAIPPDAKLRFGYGTPRNTASPITFRIRTGAGEGEEGVVFSSTLNPGERALWGGWHDAEVDLSNLAGRDVPVSLQVTTDGPTSELDLGCWASPEILTLTEREQPPNVILISIDTLRADGLSLYGNPRPTSPNIDRWAADRGIVFSRVVAPAPWTLPSHTSMFTGIDAVRHGASHNGPAPQSLTTLAEMLRGQGYRTMAVTGGAYLNPQFGLAQGFEEFKYWPDGKNTSDEIDAVAAAAQRLLERPDNSPFFLLIHTYEVHNRGRPRKEFSREIGSLDPDLRVKVIKDKRLAKNGYIRSMRSKLKSNTSETGWVELADDQQSLARDIYDSRVNYADMRLAPILERLSSAPLGGNSVVVLTSDHGEMLGEHGYAGHIYLYEENLLVPLIIADSRLNRAGLEVAQQVRTTDIVPTVLELVGLEPDAEIDGRSLLPLINGEEGEMSDRRAWSYVATSNRGLSMTTPAFKYIFNDTAWSPINQTVRFYDLEASPDEAETSPCPDELGADLLGQATSTILTTMSGTRLRFTNNLDVPIVSELGGPPITLSRIKSVGAPPGTEILSPRPSAAELRIPPGADFTVFLMDTKNQEFWVSIRGTSATALPPWEGRFNDSDAAAGRAVWFDGQVWTTGGIDGPGPSPVSLLVLPDRSHPTASESPEDIDDELRAQLEALGYL